jgi:RimJ/RimL family protein N-acetyltransferase
MTTRHWPLFALRIRTPRLELRLPSTEQLDDLVDLVLDGVHDPEYMPFGVPWTDAPREQLAYNSLSHNWQSWTGFTVQRWRLNFVVLRNGVVVGTQAIGAQNFPVLREFNTGSWVGRRFQGQGIGSEMRAGVLHFGFAGLGAQWATSTAYEDNARSLGVSRKLGYREDGISRDVRRGEPATQLRMRLSRADWETHRSVDVEFENLESCLPYFQIT